jgi:hypothetical protein
MGIDCGAVNSMRAAPAQHATQLISLLNRHTPDRPCPAVYSNVHLSVLLVSAAVADAASVGL